MLASVQLATPCSNKCRAALQPFQVLCRPKIPRLNHLCALPDAGAAADILLVAVCDAQGLCTCWNNVSTTQPPACYSTTIYNCPSGTQLLPGREPSGQCSIPMTSPSPSPPPQPPTASPSPAPPVVSPSPAPGGSPSPAPPVPAPSPGRTEALGIGCHILLIVHDCFSTVTAVKGTTALHCIAPVQLSRG